MISLVTEYIKTFPQEYKSFSTHVRFDYYVLNCTSFKLGIILHLREILTDISSTAVTSPRAVQYDIVMYNVPHL